jgi:hypothetical protein
MWSFSFIPWVSGGKCRFHTCSFSRQYCWPRHTSTGTATGPGCLVVYSTMVRRVRVRCRRYTQYFSSSRLAPKSWPKSCPHRWIPLVHTDRTLPHKPKKMGWGRDSTLSPAGLEFIRPWLGFIPFAEVRASTAHLKSPCLKSASAIWTFYAYHGAYSYNVPFVSYDSVVMTPHIITHRGIIGPAACNDEHVY